MKIDADKAKARVEDVFATTVTEVQIMAIPDHRRALMQHFATSQNAELFALTGTADEGFREFLLVVDPETGSIDVPAVSCQITFEDLSPSECPEYRFEDDPEWRVAQLSLMALDDFKAKKFRLWKHQLEEPECEAAFRRLLQQGPIRNVFDKFIFPSSDEVALKYKVTDEHSGKSVDVPHQVSEMRLWNAKEQRYEPLDCSLLGAPSTNEEATKYWDATLNELRELRGAEYIESLIGKQLHH